MGVSVNASVCVSVCVRVHEFCLRDSGPCVYVHVHVRVYVCLYVGMYAKAHFYSLTYPAPNRSTNTKFETASDSTLESVCSTLKASM